VTQAAELIFSTGLACYWPLY